MSAPRSTKLFFAIAIGGTWALQLPALLAANGTIPGGVETYFPLAGLAGFAPLIAAIVCSRREAGREGMRALLGPPERRSISKLWYLVALLLFGAIYVVGAALYRALSGDEIALLYLPENAQNVVAFFLVPLVEEPGWRGFALPRLQERFGAVRASFVLGAGWSGWHVVMFALQGFSPATLVAGLVMIVAGSVVFSWLYNRTRGSLWVAIVAHVGTHLNNPSHGAEHGDDTPLFVYTASVVVVAIVLLVADRKAWGEEMTVGVALPG